MSNQSRDARHIVYVSMHTSPLASPGAADAGGMNVVELNSAIALADKGYRVDLVTRRDDHLPYQNNIHPGVNVFALPVGPAETVAKSEQEQFIEPFRNEFAKWMNEYGRDVSLVHSHHWFSGVAALPICYKNQIAHIQTFHSVAAPTNAKDLGEGEPAESAGRISGERIAATKSHLVVAVSEAEKATIVERYDVDPKNIRVIYPGVDLELFRPITKDEPSWEWKGCYLFFAGRLQPLKGPDLAIRTLAALGPQSKHRLVIAGEASLDFERYRQELAGLANELGVAERVVHLGSQERKEFARMMRGACVLLNPSYSETFGLVNLEAAASGVPVVGSRIPGIDESVQDGITGILVGSREPNDWADAVKKLITNPEIRQRYADQARQIAAKRSWEAVANDLSKAYADALSFF